MFVEMSQREMGLISIEMGYWKELNFYMFYSIDLFYFSYKLNNLLVLVLTLVLAFLLWCYTYVVLHFVDHDTIIVSLICMILIKIMVISTVIKIMNLVIV